MSITQEYFNQNKIIYMRELNINHNMEKNICHLNVNHLDDENNWKEYLNNFFDEKNNFGEWLVKTYMNKCVGYIDDNVNFLYDNVYNRIDINYGPNYDKCRIISETSKIKLDMGKYEFAEKKLCTIELNKNELYSGITNIMILFDTSKYQIDSVKISAKKYERNNHDINRYNNIIWDLEFEEYDKGCVILGLDNFFHISLVGLKEIFFDIVYTTKLNILEDLDQIAWLKFTKCYYDISIKSNLLSDFYLNEESYSVDICDHMGKFINTDMMGLVYSN